MSMVTLRIGYMELLLPDDKGIQAVMKALARAVPCRDRVYGGVIELCDEEEQRSFEVGMRYVPKGVRIVGKNVKVEPTARVGSRRERLLLTQERDE